jgi:hypothetical protein
MEENWIRLLKNLETFYIRRTLEEPAHHLLWDGVPDAIL